MSNSSQLLELSVVVDSEAAEAVSELFNRYNGGGYDEDNEAGEAGGGGGGGAGCFITSAQDTLPPESSWVLFTIAAVLCIGRTAHGSRRRALGKGHGAPVESCLRQVRKADSTG